MVLKLPKNVASHPLAAAIEAYLSTRAASLREGGKVQVSRLSLDAGLEAGLALAFRARHLVQGLEHIAKMLDREQKGLQAAGQKPAQRMSRIIVLASDGSERFYRDAETVLAKHGERAWGVVVDADAARLGASLTAKGNPARALMIDDRATLEVVLLAIGNALPR